MVGVRGDLRRYLGDAVSTTTGAEALIISRALRGAEAPLFHGIVNIPCGGIADILAEPNVVQVGRDPSTALPFADRERQLRLRMTKER
jgi:hypothetical protein